MAKYVCDICNWEYDEAAGLPDQGIAPGTKWEELPEDFKCPLCGAPKEMFTLPKIEWDIERQSSAISCMDRGRCVFF